MSLWLFRSCSAVLLCLSIAAVSAQAQDPTTPDAVSGEGSAAGTTVKFLAGSVVALGMHEAGHLLFDVAFDAHPRLEEVHFGAIPFFAVTHDPGQSPRREFAISSAGFWVQHATDEVLLARRPHLRDEHAPLLKGMLAFNVLTSVGYSMAAFAEAGPFERDTRGMADSIGISERLVGTMILAPALLDAYRYYRPESKWAKWASRAVKAGGVLLVVRR